MNWKLFVALFIALSVGEYYREKVTKKTLEKKKIESMKKELKLTEPEKIEIVKPKEIIVEEEKTKKKTTKKKIKKNDN